MKAKLFKMEYTINLGNYQNVKLGGEWEMNETDKIEDVARAAREELAQAFRAIKVEKQEPKEQTAAQAFEGMDKAVAAFDAALAKK